MASYAAAAGDTRIRRHDAIPLYHQIYLALRDRIHSGALAYGAQVPTEHELVAQFGVSRTTAKRSLQELADSNLVVRRRRIGTRVVFQAPPPPIEMRPDQAIESLIAFGRDTAVDVVDFAREPVSAEIAALLDLAAGEPVVRARRVRSLEGEPLGVIESFVPQAHGACLSRARLNRTPLLELLRAGGHAVREGHQLISAVCADPLLAGHLAVEPRAAIVRIERLIRTASDAPIAYTIAHYRGDRYRLILDMRAVPASRPITS